MVKRTTCPLCGGQLIGWHGAGTSCLQCGYVVHLPSLWAADLLGREIDDERESEPEASKQREPRTPQ